MECLSNNLYIDPQMNLNPLQYWPVRCTKSLLTIDLNTLFKLT